MKKSDVKSALGIKGIVKLSDHTTVVVSSSGHNRPATDLEQKMWRVLQDACDE